MGSKDLAANMLEGQGQQGRQRLLGETRELQHQAACNRLDPKLLAANDSLSQCLFILANSLPPPNAPRSSVGLHLWSYFGLTFRDSLRFSSLFSSISSCSLRAAENERMLDCECKLWTVYKMFRNY